MEQQASFSLSIQAFAGRYSTLVQNAIMQGKQVADALKAIIVPEGFQLRVDQQKDAVNVTATCAPEHLEPNVQLAKSLRTNGYADTVISVAIFGRDIDEDDSESKQIALSTLKLYMERLNGHGAIGEIDSPKVEYGLSARLSDRGSKVDALRSLLKAQRA